MRLKKISMSIGVVLFLGIFTFLFVEKTPYFSNFLKSNYVDNYTEFVLQLNADSINTFSTHEWLILDSIYEDYSISQRASFLDLLKTSDLSTLNKLDDDYLELKSKYLLLSLSIFIDDVELKSEFYTENDWKVMDVKFDEILNTFYVNKYSLNSTDKLELTQLALKYQGLKHSKYITGAVDFVNEIFQDGLSIVKDALK